MPSPPIRWVALVSLLAACGSTPPPATLSWSLPDGVEVTVETRPLTLKMTRQGETIVDQAAFVEVGVASPREALRYYDPAHPQREISFRAGQSATAWNAATGRLEVAMKGGGSVGVTITAEDHLSITVDASAMKDAVLTRIIWPTQPGESVYGLGELFDTPDSAGTIRPMQMQVDTRSGSGTNETHVPVPLAISPTRSLGVFVEEYRPGAFDVGATRAEQVLATFATSTLTAHFYVGDAHAVLDQYTARTGRPRLPPQWAFAPFQWRNSTVTTTEVLEDAMTLRTLGIPTSTIWIDDPWATGYGAFDFSPTQFADPAALLAQMRALGYRVLLWSTPYINRPDATADYDDARARGYFATGATGKAFDFPWASGPGALFDFTADGAPAWWQARLAPLVAIGIAGFKLDYGEDLVPELGGQLTPFRLAAGGTDVWHNQYARVYQQTFIDALPEGDGFLLTRAGAFGSQTATTCIWPGDLDSDLSRHTDTIVGGLPAAVSGGASLASSGFPFFGSDIGGYRDGPSNTETLVRWSEYAALGTVMQLGGGGRNHNPWDATLYGPEAVDIYRRYARLHTDLFPYLFTLANRAHETGAPTTLPPGLVYAGHPYEDDFLLGDALFVAPVVEAGATTRTVTLPPGEWVDWWTGARTQGGARVTVDAPLEVLPLWQRAGSLVAMLASPVDTFVAATAPGVTSLDDAQHARGLIVRAVLGDAPAHTQLYDGTTLGLSARAESIRLFASAGTRHRDVRFEIDWKHAGMSTSSPTVEASDCDTPACWSYDDASGILTVSWSDIGQGREATIR